MPDVAGGLAFMYNLNGNDGQQITNLILDAQVIDQIFLGEITTWNDPAIAAASTRSWPVTSRTPRSCPCYRTDASGENYLLSDYLLHQDGANFTAAQNAFHSGGILGAGQPDRHLAHPDPGRSYRQPTYPGWAAGNLVGQSGSDNAANYVSSLSSQGSITYVETAYAKEHNFPVASLHERSGQAVQPTSLNVATALEAAILHTDLTQNLTNVYTNPCPTPTRCRPTATWSRRARRRWPRPRAQLRGQHDGGVDLPVRRKGRRWASSSASWRCAGQEQMATLGYSPLPPNLVQEDFDAIGRLNGGVAAPARHGRHLQEPVCGRRDPPAR